MKKQKLEVPKESVVQADKLMAKFDIGVKALEHSVRFAARFSKSLAIEYRLTYPAQVNLEGTINNMLQYGLSEDAVKDVLLDLLDNLDFLPAKG